MTTFKYKFIKSRFCSLFIGGDFLDLWTQIWENYVFGLHLKIDSVSSTFTPKTQIKYENRVKGYYPSIILKMPITLVHTWNCMLWVVSVNFLFRWIFLFPFLFPVTCVSLFLIYISILSSFLIIIFSFSFHYDIVNNSINCYLFYVYQKLIKTINISYDFIFSFPIVTS